jgi:thiamine transport system ATP-binding protein
MLHIDELTYRHKADSNLYRYTMQVDKGEIVAVMGSSGSGKSTLLDLVAGFLQPESGVIVHEGKHLEGLPVKERGVSILFQQHNLFEHLSVRKNIMLGRKGVSDEAILAMLEKVGLEGYEDRLASELSGGQQQRVALARILLREEPILLLDEPFTGLDDTSRQETLTLLREITDEHGLHTIMVTHDISDAERIADIRYLMQDHRLKKQ